MRTEIEADDHLLLECFDLPSPLSMLGRLRSVLDRCEKLTTTSAQQACPQTVRSSLDTSLAPPCRDFRARSCKFQPWVSLMLEFCKIKALPPDRVYCTSNHHAI